MSDRPNLLAEVTELAWHWRYPSGDFRYALPELAQSLREVIFRCTKRDPWEESEWKPRGPDRLAHAIVFTQATSSENTQAVCSCGHVMDSYGSTVAQRFGDHLRRVHEVTP